MLVVSVELLLEAVELDEDTELLESTELLDDTEEEERSDELLKELLVIIIEDEVVGDETLLVLMDISHTLLPPEVT